MKLFKESYIKKMLGYVAAEQMTFSRMVELLNDDVQKEIYKLRKGEPITSMCDIIRVIEAYLVQNEGKTKSRTEIKLKELRDYLKNEVVEECIEINKK